MQLSQLKEEELNEELIEKIVFSIPVYDGGEGNCIFVFGNPKNYEDRINIANSLYINKKAPKILFSGSNTITKKEPEAVLMKKYAISLGIPEKDIITDIIPNNTEENILSALLVLHREFLLQNVKRLIIISNIAHIKRLTLTLPRYMPRWVEYSYCYDENSKFNKGNWKNSEDTKRKVEREARNIIKYVKEGYIDDCEIE